MKNRLRFIIGLLLCFLSTLAPTTCFGNNTDDQQPASSSSLSSSSTSTTSTSTTSTNSRELASLAEKWNITGPLNFNYSSLEFQLTYQVSDFILNSMISEQIYDENCAEGGNIIDPSYLASQVVTTAPTTTSSSGNGDSIQSIQVSITADPETISTNPLIYKEEVVNNQMMATVRFCHRFMLFTSGGGMTPIEVNFRETVITLTVDLTDGFEIGTVQVAEKDKLIQTANQAYQVEGYQCDFTNTPLTDLQLAVARAQGTIVRVCVRPDQEARQDGIYMRSIDSFVFERDYGGSIGTVTQWAIENGGLPASNSLTEVYCNSGDEICVFESILMAIFFRLPGSVDGVGIASMQFGNQNLNNNNNNRRQRRTRRRQRQRRLALRGTEEEEEEEEGEEEDGRFLQQDNANTNNNGAVAAVAEFELNMELIPVPRARGRTSGGGRSKGKGGGACLFLLLQSVGILALSLILLLL